MGYINHFGSVLHFTQAYSGYKTFYFDFATIPKCLKHLVSCLKAIFLETEKNYDLHLNLTSVCCQSCTINFRSSPSVLSFWKCFSSLERRETGFFREFNGCPKRELWWWWWLTTEKNRSAEQTWYQGKYVVFHMQKYGMQQEWLDWVLQPDCYLLLLFCIGIILPEWVWKEIEEQGRTRMKTTIFERQILFSSMVLSEGHVPRKK